MALSGPGGRVSARDWSLLARCEEPRAARSVQEFSATKPAAARASEGSASIVGQGLAGHFVAN